MMGYVGTAYFHKHLGQLTRMPEQNEEQNEGRGRHQGIVVVLRLVNRKEAKPALLGPFELHFSIAALRTVGFLVARLEPCHSLEYRNVAMDR